MTLPTFQKSSFPSKDGTTLFHLSLVPDAPKAVVFVIHGYGDHAGRYTHVMEQLAAAGFAAHAMDYRGHGNAGGRRGFVEKYADYNGDFAAFYERVQKAHPTLPFHLVAHSHGCLLSVTSILSNTAFQFRSAVLSSPYFQMKIVPTWFQLMQANVVGKIIPWIPIKSPIAIEMLTKDPEFQEKTRKDPLYLKVVTPRWFTESNEAQKQLFLNVSKWSLPTLVLTGDLDPLADPLGGKRFYDQCSSTQKDLQTYPNMCHELFNEVERVQPLSKMVDWIASHA